MPSQWTDSCVAVACDADGLTWVSAKHNGVRVFSHDFSAEITTPFTQRLWKGATAIGFRGRRELYFVDQRDRCVSLFSANGKFQLKMAKTEYSQYHLALPWALAFNSESDVCVLDKANCCVKIYHRTGSFLYDFGRKGGARGMFLNPSGMAIIGSRFFIADTDNRRVQVLDRTGRFLNQLSLPLSYPFTCGDREKTAAHPFKPIAVAFDCAGNALVLDQDNATVCAFKADCTFISAFSVAGASIHSIPTCMCMDACNRIIVGYGVRPGASSQRGVDQFVRVFGFARSD